MTVEADSSSALPPVPTFEAMKLSEPLRRALQEVGYATPTAVQAVTFDPIAEGRDVIVQSKTGSGKTAAFAIPILDRVIRPEKRVQAMVLCPTRELALQVAGEFARLGHHSGIACVAIYGGASMSKQIDEIRTGAQVVVGTPGRVLDHLRRDTLDVKGLRTIVLDEADEMLSMGFAEDLNAILEFTPKTRQGLLFSATMPEQIQRLARRHLREPEMISLSGEQIAPTEVEHFAYFVGQGNRSRELARILEIEKADSAIVFCNTKAETETVAMEIKNLGLDAEFINGDLEQASRERILGAFRNRAVKYLVATDVAARGIDVSGVSHVVNYGFPESAEQYVHRTGRTGRAGRRGVAISLITPQDVGNLYFLRLTYGIRPIERTLPSATEDRTRREIDRIHLLREAFTREPGDEALSLARRLLTHDEAEQIVAGLLSEFFHLATKQAIAQGLSPSRTTTTTVRPAAPPAAVARVPSAVRTPQREASAKIRHEPPAPISRKPAERPRGIDVRGAEGPLDENSPEVGMEEIRLAVGRRDGIRAGDVARLVRDRAKLNRRDLGRIFVRDRFTTISVRAESVDGAIEALKGARWAERLLAPERGKPWTPTQPPRSRPAEPGLPDESAETNEATPTLVPSAGPEVGENEG